MLQSYSNDFAGFGSSGNTGNGWDFSRVDWQAGAGAFGNLASQAGGGAQNTGGSFTAMGTAIMPGWGTAVGAVLDIGLSSSMHSKAKKAAHKQARAFWENALVELGQVKKQQTYDRSALLTQQAGTGAKLESASLQSHRAGQVKEQDIAYDRMYKQLQQQYQEIRHSAGGGGLFG